MFINIKKDFRSNYEQVLDLKQFLT